LAASASQVTAADPAAPASKKKAGKAAPQATKDGKPADPKPGPATPEILRSEVPAASLA
jgi:hypothetical protein